MISTRNLMILTGVLAVLAGISFMQKSQHRNATNTSATTVVLEGEFNSNNISRLSLGFGENTEAVILASAPDGWIIESHYNARADEKRITTLLKNFSNLKGEFRSDNGKVLGQYGLLDNQSITVRGFNAAGDEVMAINVGNTPQGVHGHFIRTPGSNSVYLSQAGVLSYMGIYGELLPPKAQFFMELQAVSENQADLDGMLLRDGETTMAFTREMAVAEPAEGAAPTTDGNTGKWLLDNQPADGLDKAKIDQVLSACASIRANDVADPAAPDSVYALDNPSRSLVLARHDGGELVMAFGATREAAPGVSAGTYMRVSGNPTIWIVTDYTIKNIFKKREDLQVE